MSSSSMMEALQQWKYRKALLFTLAEILIIYNFPMSVAASAVGTLVAPDVALPLLTKIEDYVLNPLVRRANLHVVLGLVGVGLVVTLLDALLGSIIETLLDVMLFPLVVSGQVVSFALGGLFAKKNMQAYERP
mmetsp:Transcript_28066/g.34054  ORF Transcript_28066/g.34054 Transcript_28066/m.34054 type:complete len:133 (-) Transcript_28066:204-602(-)|eukprot:CAMPEP_0197851860 /NCGR_PEP_ID=MMETSP1438-20131217/19048_1 /TAXON_ID=1461541 /ORGANISM="Pterosperma sp., Strain CCMP1384" /LENGTH=132 /DNA_ID=CAMNT_0043465623 /DNA_START=154 /DNA_END=552 /DNA_ORIENTATION=-